jgi:hypothetical protein
MQREVGDAGALHNGDPTRWANDDVSFRTP